MPDERQHPPSGYTAQHFTAILHGYANGLDRLNKAMALERITLHRTTSLQNCGKGRFKTIKRFFRKLAPPISLRRIYCKQTLKQYPNQLTTSLAGIQAVTRFASQACAQLFQERQPSLSIMQDWWTLDSPSLSLHIKNSAFPPPAGTPVNDFITSPALAQQVLEADAKAPQEVDADMAGKVKYVIHSKVGCRPDPQPEDKSLVDLSTGEPKK